LLYENQRSGQYFFQMPAIRFPYGAFPSVLRT
jgi:hypothetical protein